MPQIVGIFVGISSFVWEFCREFGHFQIPKKIPNFFLRIPQKSLGFSPIPHDEAGDDEEIDHISPEKNITKSIASSIHEGLEISKNMIRSPNRSRY